MLSPEQQFEKLASGEVAIDSVAPAELFALASEFAVQGKYEEKNRIYEWILTHPRASLQERIAVLTNRADQKRRHTDPEAALQDLLEITGAEFWQALGQCVLRTDGPVAALVVQRWIMGMRDFSNFPVDKQLYYLETLIYFKLEAGQSDRELKSLFERQEELLGAPDLTEPHKSRSKGLYYMLKARLHEMSRDWGGAANAHHGFFLHALAVRDKAQAAMEYLYAVWQIDPSISSGTTAMMAEFFKANHHEMQSTDIAATRAKYESVCRCLGV